MTATARRFALALSFALAAPAALAAPVTPEGIRGGWRDTSGTRYVVNGRGMIKKIIDTDGEKFICQQQDWVEGKTIFTYFVPSTGYHVTVVLDDLEGDVLHTLWRNDHDAAGEEDWFRR